MRFWGIVPAAAMFCCSLAGQVWTAPSPPVPPPSPAPAQTPAAMMAASAEEAGKTAVALWRKRYPEILGGRVALGWDPRIPGATAAAKGAAAADPSLRPLPDLGVTAEDMTQALRQLSPETFSGILWLETLQGPGGEMKGLSFVHRALGKAEETRLEMILDPPIPPPKTPIPSPGLATSPAEIILRLTGIVSAAALSESGDELWFASGGRLVRRSMAEDKDLQEWPPSEGDDPKAPRALRLFTEEEGLGKVGWCTAGRGGWFAVQDKEYRRGAAFEGFPLAEKESKFLKAPWIAEEGAFALQDHQGKDLGHFLSLVRVRTEAGESLLILLQRDGALKALRGNSLEVLLPPAEGTFTALAGWRDRVAVAEAAPPHRIRIFRAGEGAAWESQWISGPLPGPVSALCIGRMKGRTSVLAFVVDGEGTLAMLLPVP